MPERSVKRQAVELLGALALPGSCCSAGWGLAGYGLLRVADENVTHLDEASRAQIERSGCARLRSLLADYRGCMLHCDPPIRTPCGLESN
jgi:hypothetical protein